MLAIESRKFLQSNCRQQLQHTGPQVRFSFKTFGSEAFHRFMDNVKPGNWTISLATVIIKWQVTVIHERVVP